MLGVAGTSVGTLDELPAATGGGGACVGKLGARAIGAREGVDVPGAVGEPVGCCAAVVGAGVGALVDVG